MIEKFLAFLGAIVLFFLPMAPVDQMPLGNGEIIASWKKPVNSPALSNVVHQSLSGTKGKYYVYIRHLATGESYAQNQNEVIMSGSLYKAWLALGVLEEIRKGRLSGSEVLSESIVTLNKWANLDPDEAELSSGKATYSVSEALKQMLAVSHNYSAFLLTRKVGNPKVQKILKTRGLSNTHFVRPPTVSAADMALYFDKVYLGRFFPD